MKEPTAGYCGIYKGKPKQFHVCYYADGNIEMLASSETVESKANALKNIRAMAKLFKGTIPNVWDCTVKPAKLIKVNP